MPRFLNKVDPKIGQIIYWEEWATEHSGFKIGRISGYSVREGKLISNNAGEMLNIEVVGLKSSAMQIKVSVHPNRVKIFQERLTQVKYPFPPEVRDSEYYKAPDQDFVFNIPQAEVADCVYKLLNAIHCMETIPQEMMDYFAKKLDCDFSKQMTKSILYDLDRCFIEDGFDHILFDKLVDEVVSTNNPEFFWKLADACHRMGLQKPAHEIALKGLALLDKLTEIPPPSAIRQKLSLLAAHCLPQRPEPLFPKSPAIERSVSKAGSGAAAITTATASASESTVTNGSEALPVAGAEGEIKGLDEADKISERPAAPNPAQFREAMLRTRLKLLLQADLKPNTQLLRSEVYADMLGVDLKKRTWSGSSDGVEVYAEIESDGYFKTLLSLRTYILGIQEELKALKTLLNENGTPIEGIQLATVFEQKKREIEQLTNQIVSLEAALEQKKAEIGHLTNEKVSVEAAHEQKRTEIAQLTNQIVSLNAAHADQIEKREQQLILSEQQLKYTERLLESREKHLQVCEQQAQDFKIQLAGVMGSFGQLTEEYAQLAQEHKAKLASTEAELLGARKSLVSREAELREVASTLRNIVKENETKFGEMTAKIGALTNQVEALTQEKQSQQARHEKEIAELNGRLEQQPKPEARHSELSSPAAISSLVAFQAFRQEDPHAEKAKGRLRSKSLSSLPLSREAIVSI